MASFSTLFDNFNDNSIDLGLWNPVLAVEEDTVLKLEPTSGFSSASLTSVSTYDLTDTSIVVKIEEIVNYTSDDWSSLPLFIYKTGSNFYFRTNGVQIDAGYMKASGASAIAATEFYDPAIHKWLRLTHSSTSGLVYWDHSADGSTWTPMASVVPPLTVDNFTFRSYIVNAGTVAVPTLIIDNVNYLPLADAVDSTTSTSSSALASVTYHLSASGTTSTSSSNSFVVSRKPQELEKSYLVKIYDADGNFLGVWKDRLDQAFTYYQQINNLGSAVTFRLGRSARNLVETRANIQTEAGDPIQTNDARNIEAAYRTFKTVGEGTDVDLNYRVDVFVYEGSVEAIETTSGEIIKTESGDPIEAILGSPDGRRVYSGWISKYAAYYGQDEYVDVTVLNHSTELDNYVVNNGTDTTVTYNSTDPAQMLRNILDQYATDGGTLTYTNQTIELTGTTSSYTFRLTTIKEAIDKILELSPDDWYWYIDQGTSEVHMHQVSTTADHQFTFQKEIQEVRIERHIEDLVNNVYFAGGGDPQLLKQYEDTTSQTDWRLGTKILSDGRVTVAGSAQTISEALIERNKEPVYTSEVRILDKKYRTEDITLGDTVTFANFGNFVDDVVLMISAIRYDKYGVNLSLGTLLPEMNKRLEEVRRNLRLADTNNVPDTPS